MKAEQEARAWAYLHERATVEFYGDELGRQRSKLVPKITRALDGPMFEGTPCWNWTGGLSTDKQPVFSYGTGHLRDDGRQESRTWIVFNYMMRIVFKETPPKGARFAQLCYNNRCVSPYHRMRGRHGSAPRPHKRKISEEGVVLILEAAPGSVKMLAGYLGIGYSTALNMRAGNVSAWQVPIYERVTGKKPKRFHKQDPDKIIERRRIQREKEEAIEQRREQKRIYKRKTIKDGSPEQEHRRKQKRASYWKLKAEKEAADGVQP